MHELVQRFRSVAPAVDGWSIRICRENHDRLMVTRGVLQPVDLIVDLGAMITIRHNGGEGYAATSDLSASGLRAAAERARGWADQSAARALFNVDLAPLSTEKGTRHGPVQRPWSEVPLAERIALLQAASKAFEGDPTLVTWWSGVWASEVESLFATSAGGEIQQQAHFMAPTLRVIASDGSDSIMRSMGRSECRQGGVEVLDTVGFHDAGPRLARQARELLKAPQCPSGKMDVILAADQMVLQIHESIGHPLELDRILGDERNFAGTSFVQPEMFGSFQYGSEHLNITFDPDHEAQFASYGWDDDGTRAERSFVIKDGVLLRGLGGLTSQARSSLPGVASARSCRWSRPTLDRMANLNLEPGDSDLPGLIAQVEHGVYMESNLSWSIDDSRNKFQFGCEYARIIENGELGEVVKKPNYRGVSSAFWRGLKGVGSADEFRLMGTPFCGKGEPNQVIRVGHATPPCLFGDVDVFGGA